MKTSKGFIRSPACSDVCEESHVRLLSLANRIFSNRFSEKMWLPRGIVYFPITRTFRETSAFFFSAHVCMCVYAYNCWVSLFSVVFCLCGVALGAVREISWPLTQLPVTFYRCWRRCMPAFLRLMSNSHSRCRFTSQLLLVFFLCYLFQRSVESCRVLETSGPEYY